MATRRLDAFGNLFPNYPYFLGHQNARIFLVVPAYVDFVRRNVQMTGFLAPTSEENDRMGSNHISKQPAIRHLQAHLQVNWL